MIRNKEGISHVDLKDIILIQMNKEVRDSFFTQNYNLLIKAWLKPGIFRTFGIKK